MNTGVKKLEIIDHIVRILDADKIKKLERFIDELDDDDRYYKRERFYEDGKPIDKVEEKPKLINEARRKIKRIFKFQK